MQYTQKIHGNEMKLAIRDRFTFSDNKIFRDILRTIELNHVTRLIIDFSSTSFIDSAALGMLLLAREDMRKKGGSIVLSNTNGQVEKIFNVSQFHTLFEMA